MKLRIVFMGSPDFALPTLEALHEIFNVVGVVTQPDRPAGRGRALQAPEVKILAEKLGLPIIQPSSLKNPGVIDQLNDWAPDVIVVAAFGQILRDNVLSLPQFGCVNVHASLLPRWRGAAPIQAAILYDDVTGVTIMKMDSGLDTGSILAQRKVAITADMTAGRLFDILAHLGANLLVEILPGYVKGDIQPCDQEEKKATYAPRLKKEDGKLDFYQPAEILARKVRAFNPWPGTYQYYDDQRIKVLQAHVEKAEESIPGKRYILDDKPAWGTIKNMLVLDEVQVAGRICVSGAEFLHGEKNWLN